MAGWGPFGVWRSGGQLAVELCSTNTNNFAHIRTHIKKNLQSPMDDSSAFNPSRASPDEQPNKVNQPISGYPAPQFATNYPPQFSHPLQPPFPGNFNPYGMPPYQPYGGFHHSNPYEANFNISPSVVFGRGATSEGVRSSSPVESMVFGRYASGSSPASPISPAPRTNDVNNQA